MAAAEVVEALRTRFDAREFALGAEVEADSLLEVLRALRDVHGYRYYVSATAVDGTEEIELLHGVRNLESNDDFWVRVRLSREQPEVDSAALLYTGAEWHEREVLDLFGVIFRSHPDPRRILMPDDYDGHPLRKDFSIDTPWGYRPSTRAEKS